MSDALVTVLPVAGYDKEKVIAAIRTIFAREKLSEKIRPGIRIFVKVNLVREMPPEKAATTHPVIVEAVCEELMAMGAEVTVGDSCGGLYTEKHMSSVYSTTGMTKACEESGAKLNADFTAGEVFCSDSAVLKSMQIINAFLSADAVINISKLKTHGLTGYSGAVKNLFGLIPGLVKVEMHSKFNTLESFCNCLIDIERFASEKIILHIIDGIVGMEGNGPTNGNPVELGVIAASSDAYLADAAALSIFTEAAENPVMECAAARGIVDTGSEAFVSAAERADASGNPTSKSRRKTEPFLFRKHARVSENDFQKQHEPQGEDSERQVRRVREMQDALSGQGDNHNETQSSYRPEEMYQMLLLSGALS